jgi:hypothetical protein
VAVRELSVLFGDRIISEGLRLPHLSDFPPPDFFYLWGYIKDSAYRNNPCKVDELKTNIDRISSMTL